jgi:TolB-like protein
MSLFNELKRRNVFRVGIAYLVVAWLVVQVSDVMIDNIGAPEWLFKFILLALAIGFPIATVFAWAFEMTPDGIKRENQVDRTQSIAPQTGRKLDYTIIAVLALALGYFVYESRFSGPDTELITSMSDEPSQQVAAVGAAAANSVAVLPFVNMSDDAANEYFSDGLTETLLHMLAQIPDLQVAARTSSFAFKGKNEAISEVAKTLGVAHVLEGSVQKAEGQVRITAQLIRAEDGFHMWSQNYTRPLKDIFAIQDEIATDVADALGASLLGNAAGVHGVATKNLSAYDSYLKGLKEQATFSYSTIDDAERHFKQALVEDPEFTDARLALVRNYILKRQTGLINKVEQTAQATPLLQRVFKSDPDNLIAQAYDLYIRILVFPPGRTETELRDMLGQLRGLLAQMPTDSFLRAGVAQVYSGALDEHIQAMEILQSGLLIDPLDADIYQQLAFVYLQMKDYKNAISANKRVVALAPDNPNGYYNLADSERWSGNLRGYFENVHKAIEIDPQDHELTYSLATNLYLLDLSEEGEYWYQRTQALSPASVVARELSVERAYYNQQPEQVIALSEQIIRDQMDDRLDAFFLTVFYYTDTMMKLDRSREAYDFLVSVRPEIASFDVLPNNTQGMSMQRFSIILMSGFASREEMQAAYGGYSALMDARGFDWMPPESNRKTMDLLMHDDLQGAVDQFVNLRMSRPVAIDLFLHRKVMPQLYNELYADPLVAAKMAERGREFAAMREDIRSMLQEPQWQQ